MSMFWVFVCFVVNTGNILVSAVLFPAMCSYFLQLEALYHITNGKSELSEKHRKLSSVCLSSLRCLKTLLKIFGIFVCASYPLQESVWAKSLSC